MAFTPLFFTGFEDRNMGRPNWSFSHTGGGDCSIAAGGVGGSYAAQVSSSNAAETITFQTGCWAGQSDIYIGFWFRPTYLYIGYSPGGYIYFYLDDGNYLRIQINSNHWDGYVNGSLVATGSVIVTANWQHVQVHIVVADGGAGVFDCKVDGVSNFTYAGDTKPGAGTTVTQLQFYGGNSGNAGRYCDIDNVVVGTGGWPGDLRAVALTLNGDTATAEWTPSTGATNYGCIDEAPVSDTDYISTTLTGKRSIMTLSDFDDTRKTPLALTQIIRMMRDTANADTIKYGLISGGTEVTFEPTLSTAFAFYEHLFTTDPNGNIAWTDAALDALQAVVESVIA